MNRPWVNRRAALCLAIIAFVVAAWTAAPTRAGGFIPHQTGIGGSPGAITGGTAGSGVLLAIPGQHKGSTGGGGS